MNHESDIHGGFSVGKRENCMEKNRYGFTLAELLVVVAIIGVLVGVSIPIFAGQLEKAREATDIANVRSAYSEVMSDAITENHADGSTYDASTGWYTKIVQLKQKQNGWQTSHVNIAGITEEDTTRWQGQVRAEGECTVYYAPDKQSATLLWGGYAFKHNYQWKLTGDSIEDQTISLAPSSSVNSNWQASAITNAIDAKINVGQTLNIKAIPDSSTALKQQLEAGYHYEIGFFVADKNGKVVVNHGFEVLSINQNQDLSLEITTDPNKLSKEANASGEVRTSNLPGNGEDCKVMVQVFRVQNGTHSSSVPLSEQEAAELSKLISFDSTTTTTP